MPAAFIPSPGRGLWHIGLIPVRGYALCVIAGILLCLWSGEWRYRLIGGRPGLILDLAAWAVPSGLAGGRLYGVLISYQLYFGAGHDWANVLRFWDGPFGLPGAVAAGALAAWLGCRRAGAAAGPVAGAVAPGLAFAAAVICWGSWFAQESYGRPSGAWWAVEISPEHRVTGYENFTTFAPTFLYQSVWDVLTGVMVILAARRFLLSGDRVFAVYAALQATGSLFTQQLQIGYAQHLLGLRAEQAVMIVVLGCALSYLYLTREKKGPDGLGPAPGTGPAAGPAVAAAAGPARRT
ncbi:MAG TPA: prolipoprotein diacylglyceryl transferase family protein [Streptosporangiaceae bacterium]|jgi:prolipoprotein diacylglyceryltransferase